MLLACWVDLRIEELDLVRLYWGNLAQGRKVSKIIRQLTPCWGVKHCSTTKLTVNLE